jgi:hypothetical protein
MQTSISLRQDRREEKIVHVEKLKIAKEERVWVTEL